MKKVSEPYNQFNEGLLLLDDLKDKFSFRNFIELIDKVGNNLMKLHCDIFCCKCFLRR